MATGQGASLSEGLDEKDLWKLYEALYRVRTSYMPIALKIGVQIGEIEGVESKQTDSGRRLLEILTIRLRQTEKLTWGDIVEALRSECVGQGKVADEIEKKYCLAATAEGKQHEKHVQFDIRKSQGGNKQKELYAESDPPMNKEKVSDKQDSDSEGEGSEKVKRKVHSEKPHSKTKRKGEKVKEVGKTQKRLEVVESNDENLNERKRKRRSKQKGEPPLYQEEVSYKQDSDSEGEGSEKVKQKMYSEKPRSKTTRKGEKVREKAEMSVACSPEQEVELAKKKEGNVQKKESFKQGEKERGTENKLQRNKKAVHEKDKNFGKETVSDSHTEQEVNTQTQAVIVESDDEYFTASSGAEMESTQFQNKTTKEASPQYAKGESHLKGAMKKRRRKDKYSSAAAAAGEETESEDESSYARVSKEEESSNAQSPEPRRKPMPKVRTPKPVHTETIGGSWSKVSKRSNEKAEQSTPSSMYHSKGSRPKDRVQKVEKKGRGIPPEKKAAVVLLELATDDRNQEECEEEQEWDSDESEEEEDSEQNEEEETGPGSEPNQVEKKRRRGIPSEKKAAAVPLEPASVNIIEEESGEETRDLDDRSEYEDSEQKLSSEEEEAGSDGESSPATSEDEEKIIAVQPERRKHVKGKTSTENASAPASRYDVPERSDPSPRGGVKGAKKKKKKIKHKEREMVKPSSSLSTSPEERPKQPTSRGQRRKTGQREGKKGKSEKRRRRAEGLMIMSSSETDDSSSPECDISKKLTEDEAKKVSKVFKRFFGKLCYGIVNPAEIAAQLQEKHLISQETMIDMLRSPESQQEKTINLVSRLSKRIESRPYRMYRFIEVLLGNSVLQGAGREILRETGM